MPKLADKTICCGCSACANKCAKGAIVMTPDEGGFLNPMVNNSLCVECGLCEKACPAIGPTSEPTAIQRAFLIQHKDETIRRQSTSGGAFTAIAQSIIDEGGIVYGACMKDGGVFHIGVERTEDLALFRNSKYVQSDMKGAFKEVKAHLAANRSVCFSGTPCQIAGLKYYLGKSYENLLTVDVVCHAIPSPYIFERYVELTKKRLPNAQKLVFRDKKRGYSLFAISIFREEKKIRILIAGASALTILLSQSGNGIIGLAVVSAVYALYYVKKKNSKVLIITVPIACVMALSALLYFAGTDMGQELSGRAVELQDSDNTSEQSSGFFRIYRGYFVYGEYNVIEMVTGINNFALIREKIRQCPFSFTFSENDMYFNTIQNYLIKTGLIGLFLYILFLWRQFKKSDYCSRSIILTLFVLSFMANIYLSYIMILYLLIPYFSNKSEICIKK